MSNERQSTSMVEIMSAGVTHLGKYGNGSANNNLLFILDEFSHRNCNLIAVLETHSEKLLARRASKLKKLLVLLKSSLLLISRV